MTLTELKPAVLTILNKEERSLNERLYEVCNLLREEVAHYDWVGFYFIDASKKQLHLGPYVGAPTDHTVIPFGRGICGQVAVSNENFVVPDVHAQDNYIACSITVKSEIVIPLFVDGQNIGQIDIDSNTVDAFNEKDEQFLEFVNTEIAKRWER